MSESAVMNLSVGQLAIAYVFVLVLLAIFRRRGIRREKEILIATTRMTVQLTAMGFILVAVFQHAHWWLTLLMIGVMLAAAVYNAIHRVRIPMNASLKRLVALSMIVGALSVDAFFIIVILQVRPWFDPQYFIPISGMVIGNSMTGIALGANRLCTDMAEKREIIENSLMLGATPFEATRQIVNDAFDSAILPTMNNMLTMGLVSLPGMMTGQILSGTFPLTAIKYQIGIMLAILGATALATVLFVTLGYRTFFSKDARLLAVDQRQSSKSAEGTAVR